jgi:hypothetical protein
MHLTLTDIAERLQLNVPLDAVHPESAHIGADGRAMVVCSLRGPADHPDLGHLAIALDGPDLVLAHLPKDIAPRFGVKCGSAAWGDGLIFLSRRVNPNTGETLAVFLPRDGKNWGKPQPLLVAPDLPIRVTSKGFKKPVMPGRKGIGHGDIIAWPVEAGTGDDDTSVKSVIFVQPDPATARLDWSYWPRPPKPKGFLQRVLGKDLSGTTPQDFIRPDPGAYPLFKNEIRPLPNLLSASFVDDRLLITSDGATEVKKYGDRCAAISEVNSDGSVSHLYLENLIAADRPDASKRHDYQARFVDRGRKVLLKSAYKTTDPWNGGFALFDIESRMLAACKSLKCHFDGGPLEVVGDQALFAEFEEKTDEMDGRLSIRLEKIAFT